MKASTFSIIYVIVGGLLLMFGTPFVATLGMGGIIASILICLLWFIGSIIVWNKFGKKDMY